jgi:hypothetical protein
MAVVRVWLELKAVLRVKGCLGLVGHVMDFSGSCLSRSIDSIELNSDE